jgi:hypothetical protein
MEIERREFLKLLGISGVAAVVPGCSSDSPRKLIPYLIPEELRGMRVSAGNVRQDAACW